MLSLDGWNETVGCRIANRPGLFIVLSLSLIAVLSIGLCRLDVETDIRRSFAPRDSPATRESLVYMRFYGFSRFPQRAFLVIRASDRKSSMLRPGLLKAAESLDRSISHRLNDPLNASNSACHPMCQLNAPFHLLVDAVTSWDTKNDNESMEIRFPIAQFHSYPVFLGMHLLGVNVSKCRHNNNSQCIDHVNGLILWYFSQVDSNERLEHFQNVSMELFRDSQSEKTKNSTTIHYEIFADQIANTEMIRGAYEATFLMCIGLGLLLGFMLLVLRRLLDWPRYLPVLVVAAGCPLLASLAAFGALAWMDIKFYPIQCVVAFLVVGIGVDDAFILLHVWREEKQREEEQRGEGEEEQEEQEEAGKRLCRVLKRITSSISITSLTNAVAFGVGASTPTPQMSIFCLSTSIAVLLDYVLTFSLLAPVLILVDGKKKKRRKRENEEDVLSRKRRGENEEDVLPKRRKGENEDVLPGRRGEENEDVLPRRRKGRRVKELILVYSRFVCTWRARLIALVMLIVLYTISLIGVVTMKTAFEPTKAFPGDSPLVGPIVAIRAAFEDFFLLHIFIQKAPDLRNSIEKRMFDEMVEELEALPGSHGPGTSLSWISAYEEFDHRIYGLLSDWALVSSPYSLSFQNLPQFLRSSPDPLSVRYHRDSISGNISIDSFRMALLGRGMSEWFERGKFLVAARSVLSRYPSFEASPFDGDAPVVDLMLTAKRDLVMSIAITVVCMALVCLFFLRSRIGLLLVTLLISSICFTLVGLLSWWGADLDPVTIIDCLIAVGFSVDFTAHIATQFYAASVDQSAKTRIGLALGEMTEPMLQAGISTVLCMLPLFFVSTYCIVAFAKTVLIVVSVGLFHGLFILPVLLVITSQRQLRPVVLEKTEKGSQSETSSLLVITSQRQLRPVVLEKTEKGSQSETFLSIGQRPVMLEKMEKGSQSENSSLLVITSQRQLRPVVVEKTEKGSQSETFLSIGQRPVMLEKMEKGSQSENSSLLVITSQRQLRPVVVEKIEKGSQSETFL